MAIREEIYKFFADYIFQKSGMVYSPNDYYRLESRLNDLVRILEVQDVEAVYQMYKTRITPDMNAILINISTNNETYFFRDVKPFSVLAKQILPEIMSNNAGTINLWSAASSTGQEAYSILMATKNTGEPVFNRLSVYASDISTDALNRARAGNYTGLEVQRGLPIAMLMKYFNQKSEESWEIDRTLVNKVKFFEFNLLKDVFPRDFYHIIFCRNVLIYQDKDNKNAILNNLYNAIKPGGYLFMGNGESLIGMQTGFEKETVDGYTIYKKKV